MRQVVRLTAGLHHRPHQGLGKSSRVERRSGPRTIQTIPVTGRLGGYAGSPNQKAAEVQTKYIVVDMYAKAIQGMAPADAVKWAHGEMVKVYSA